MTPLLHFWLIATCVCVCVCTSATHTQKWMCRELLVVSTTSCCCTRGVRRTSCEQHVTCDAMFLPQQQQQQQQQKPYCKYQSLQRYNETRGEEEPQTLR